MRSGLLVAMCLGAALVMSSCDQTSNQPEASTPPPQDQARPRDVVGSQDRLAPFLQAARFYEPHKVEGRFVQMGGDPNSGDVAALFVEVGAMQVVPWTERKPYWRLAYTDIPPTDNKVVLPFAKRRVIGRAEDRSWTEGSTEYFAETLTYVLDIDERFHALHESELGPFSVRITIANNPRVGHWALSGLQYTGYPVEIKDERTTRELISKLGSQAQASFQAKIEQAKLDAYDQIAANYEREGLIERVSDNPLIFERKKDYLALYVYPERIGRATLAELVQKCDQLDLPGYGKWRMAGRNQLSVFRNDDVMLDAPDGRIWGGLEGTVIVPSVSSYQRSKAYSLYDTIPEPIYGPYVHGFRLKNFGLGGSYSAAFKPEYQRWSPQEIMNTPVDFTDAILMCFTSTYQPEATASAEHPQAADTPSSAPQPPNENTSSEARPAE